MKPKQVELCQSARDKRGLPSLTCPEIALVGRSNVGKSSLINTLVQRRNLARTSNTPGKTRAIYFYLVDGKFFLVDLPGYGYARVSREQQREWKNLVEAYLDKRKGYAMLLQVVDLRHPPSEADRQMANWIRHFAYPWRVVATKADKVPRGRRLNQLKIIAAGLEVDPAGIILFSSSSGEGKDLLWGAILDELGNMAKGDAGSAVTPG